MADEEWEGVSFESDDTPEFDPNAPPSDSVDAPTFESTDEPAFEEADPEVAYEEADPAYAEGDEWDDEWDEEWEESDIEVEGKAGFTVWALAGIVLMVLGTAFFITGAILFLMGFPDQWYATNGEDYYESRSLVEGVVIGVGGGILALLLGNAMFQFGQTFTGSGYIHVEDE